MTRSAMCHVVAVCGMWGGLYYATATRIYEAESQLLVVDTSRENSPTSMTGSRSDIAAMATYEKLVSSPPVLQSAATLLDAQCSCGELNAARRSLVSSAITPVNPSIMG